MRTFHGYSLVVLALVGAGVFAWYELRQVADTPSFEVASVARGDVSHVVSVTGRAEPLERLSLAFPSGGRIASLAVEEGALVVQGAVLATLDHALLEAQAQEANARIVREKALYEELIAPIRTESSQLEDAKVSQANSARTRGEETARTTLERAYVLAEDALHRQVDTLFERAPEGGYFGIEYESGNTTYRIRGDYRETMLLNDLRSEAERVIAGMRDRANDTSEVSDLLAITDMDLAVVERLCTELARVINEYRASSVEEDAVYAPFRTAVYQARSSIAQLRGEVVTAKSTYDGLAHAYNRALRERDLALSGVRTETVRTQQAAIALAQEGYAIARARVEESLLTSPISGRVVRVNPAVGETVHAFDEVLMIEGGVGMYEVQTYIPEADIARVSLGDSASITFDAFGREFVFTGEVVRIALAETVREGVPTYKTTIVISEVPNMTLQIRPGMTADIDITTDERSGVLMVPTRSVLSRDDQTYVRLVRGAEYVERLVSVGLRGSLGMTEVVDGLNEGDMVVVYVKEE